MTPPKRDEETPLGWKLATLAMNLLGVVAIAVASAGYNRQETMFETWSNSEKGLIQTISKVATATEVIKEKIARLPETFPPTEFRDRMTTVEYRIEYMSEKIEALEEKIH